MYRRPVERQWPLRIIQRTTTTRRNRTQAIRTQSSHEALPRNLMRFSRLRLPQ
jgi:hypothetical protein